MDDSKKLTGGRKPYFINDADGMVDTKKFYMLVVLEPTVFTALNAGETDELATMNIGAKELPAGTIITCDGDDYHSEVHLTSGLVAGYEAFVND